MAQSFRDLVVWQRAMQLTVAVYKLTQEFPREEQYGLTGQIRRSVVSIPSNIAEGQGRRSAGEFRQFLGIAKGLKLRGANATGDCPCSQFGIASLDRRGGSFIR